MSLVPCEKVGGWGEAGPSLTLTCCYVKVLVVYDDAFSHLLKIHVVLVSGLSDPGGLDWAWRDIFLLFLL